MLKTARFITVSAEQRVSQERTRDSAVGNETANSDSKNSVQRTGWAKPAANQSYRLIITRLLSTLAKIYG
jgi:hypothetical protein